MTRQGLIDEGTMTINSTSDRALLTADNSSSNPERNEHALRCPECGEATGLHIDGVVVENAAGQRLQVDAEGEDDGARLNIRLENDEPHDGRRHMFSLTGSCEHCRGNFSLGFKQHKGMTYFSKTSNA